MVEEALSYANGEDGGEVERETRPTEGSTSSQAKGVRQS